MPIIRELAREVEELKSLGFDYSEVLGADHGGDAVRVKCSQCQATFVNGMPCHEKGCPNQNYGCKGCNARVSRRGAYCEDCM